MLRMTALLVLALTVIASVPQARADNAATRGTNATTGITTEEARDRFVNRTNTELDKYATRIDQLKKNRDAQMTDSDEYGRLNGEVEALDVKLREVRGNLAILESASLDNWRQYEKRVDDNLHELRFFGMAAE